MEAMIQSNNVIANLGVSQPQPIAVHERSFDNRSIQSKLNQLDITDQNLTHQLNMSDRLDGGSFIKQPPMKFKDNTSSTSSPYKNKTKSPDTVSKRSFLRAREGKNVMANNKLKKF